MTLTINTNNILEVSCDNVTITRIFKDHTQIFENRKRSALEWLEAGYTESGIYTIYPDGINPIDVYCDMTTD